MAEAGGAAFDGTEGWAILELMGRVRLAGYLREATIAGGRFLRLDVPPEDATITKNSPPSPAPMTQFYSPSAVYCITPTTEATVRRLHAATRVPVQTWELPELPAPKAGESTAGDEGDVPW